MDTLEYAQKAACDEFIDRLKDLPLSLTVGDIADLLGVCLTTAYKLVSQEGFSKITLPGVKRVIIPKVRFIQWYMGQDDSPPVESL